MVSLCVLALASDALAIETIETAMDAHEIIPLEYNGQTGNLVFKIDTSPFETLTVPVDSNDRMGVYIGINYDGNDRRALVHCFERGVNTSVAVKGGQIRKSQLLTVHVGYNITSVRIVTGVGYSEIWDISPKPIGIGKKAIATPTEWENFWVLCKNVPSGDPGTLSVKTKTVNASTYFTLCADRLNRNGYDFAKQIKLPTKFGSIISQL